MARAITYRMAEALRKGKPLAVLAEIDHPSGTFRCWTGIGYLEYNGFTWTGIGLLGSISPIKSTSDLSIQEINFSLSGVNPETLALLDDAVRNLEANVWLAALDSKNQIIKEPYQLLNCILDYQTFSIDDNGSATVSIIARSSFYTIERAIDEVWSNEDQTKRFPTDTGLSLLHTLENQQVIWTKT